jgi:hypothetical protein
MQDPAKTMQDPANTRFFHNKELLALNSTPVHFLLAILTAALLFLIPFSVSAAVDQFRHVFLTIAQNSLNFVEEEGKRSQIFYIPQIDMFLLL